MNNQISIILLNKDYNITEEDELVMSMSSMSSISSTNENPNALLVHIDYTDNEINIILHTSNYYLRFYLLNNWDVNKLKINKSYFIMDECIYINDKTMIKCSIQDVN